MFYSHDPFTPVETLFQLSKLASAYPARGWCKCFSIFTICLCGGFIIYGMSSDVTNFVSTTLIQTILEVLDIIEDTLLFIVLCLGYYAYRTHDVDAILRSIYLGHEAILKLGVVPRYRKYWSVVLASLVCLEMASEYSGIYETYVDHGYFPAHAVMTEVLAGTMPTIVTHLYVCQYYAFMELIQDQMSAIVEGMIYHNHWYLESMTLVQSQLLRTAHAIFEMYKKIISVVIVHSTITMMITAYAVAKLNNFFRIGVLLFELIAVISILHACDQTKAKADAFNAALFDLMRKNKDLCSNSKLHLYVTMKHTINFTACGFFNLGYPLVTSIIAAATTYLVILIQFSLPPAPPPK